MTVGSRKPSNSVLIAANEIIGVSNLVKLMIVVEGRLIKSYKDFQLKQRTAGHHEFTLVLDHDSLGSIEDHHLEQAQKLLGKRILVVFSYRNLKESPERDFIGVITQVGLSRENKNHGNIVLSGFSPTILLDGSRHNQSFGGDVTVSLSMIARDVIVEGLGSEKYQISIDSTFGKVVYSCQYEETHYNYLVRLAESYGEQFYYDGDTLRFGRFPYPEKAIELTFGRNVDQVDIQMKTLHVNPRYYGYNSNQHQSLHTDVSRIKAVSSLGQLAYTISQKTFLTRSLQTAPLKANTTKDIDATQDSVAGSRAVETFITKGRTSVPFLYPGCLVEMEMLKPGTHKSTYFTRLMIVEVSHSVDKLGNYVGHFEAVGHGTGYLPKAEFHMPRAEAQFATVIDNQDEKGRVQVRFDWQSRGEQSPWIRVLSPDAGLSEKVSKNRGFVFIPEVGDQVMVGFMHGHPDRPYVMGGLFHGKAGAGGGKGNNVKSLSSKSGNKLELNDTHGSVFLTDRGGVNLLFDGAGNATINAHGDNTVNAGNTNVVNVGATEDTPAQAILSMDASGNILLESKTNITIKTGVSSITLTSEGTITIEGLEVKVIGKTRTELGKVGANPGVKIDADVTIKGGNIIEN